MKFIETVKLTAGYKKARNIIKDINITIDEGEIVGLFGTNGAGKSTVLKSIMGLLFQQEGQIRYHYNTLPGQSQGTNGNFLDISHLSISQRSRLGIKYLTQDAQLFPSYTVHENLKFVMGKDTKSFDQRLEEFCEIFKDLKIQDILNKKGNLLSGGQRATTAIAMVLITKPRLLMLDEPSAGLAPELVSNLLQGLKQYKEKQGNGGAIILCYSNRS